MTVVTLDDVARQAQEYYKLAPVIILGSGASAAFGMSGMGDLAKHLIKTVDVSKEAQAIRDAWGECCNHLNSGLDLESVLHKINLDAVVSAKVVRATWDLLNPQDLKIFNQSMASKAIFPLGTLLRHYFTSTQSQVNIITSNYDRLAEYSCEQEGIHHYTGFSYGFRRHAVPRDYLVAKRQVNIWKVHGSLDWFAVPSGGIVCLGNSTLVPPDLVPLIVTPGVEKYRSTHREPYKSIIHESDNALDAAHAYLCIGFGFNDEHIQEKLINRCATNSAKVIVITYELSKSAKAFLFSGKVASYLAIERGSTDDSSIVYSSKCSDPLVIDRDAWSLKGFLTLVM